MPGLHEFLLHVLGVSLGCCNACAIAKLSFTKEKIEEDHGHLTNSCHGYGRRFGPPVVYQLHQQRAQFWDSEKVHFPGVNNSCRNQSPCDLTGLRLW